MHLTRLLRLNLLLVLPVMALPSASPLVAQAERDSIQAILVGRRETAEVQVDFPRTAQRYDMPWGTTEPISPGLATPFFLQSTLPLRFGKAQLPAGRYQLWTVMRGKTPTLIVTAPSLPTAAEFGESQVLLRVPLTVTELDHQAEGVSVRIRFTRVSEDTIRITDRSNYSETRLVKEIIPGTTATLGIQLGRWLMTTPISAR